MTSDEFAGFGPPAGTTVPPDVPEPDADGNYTLSGQVRNVRTFTEDAGIGEARYQLQVVSFTVDDFAPGGLRRSVYAEIRGASLGRRPVENELVHVTGTFRDGRLDVRTWSSDGDDPHLPIPKPRRRFPRPVALALAGALAIVAFAVGTAIVKGREPAPSAPGGPGGPPASAATPTVRDATGDGPWVIEGQGYRYEFESVVPSRTTPWMEPATASLTIRGHVTRTEAGHSGMSYEVRDQDGRKLAEPGISATFDDHGATAWESSPAMGQRLPIVLVVLDGTPPATSVTVAIADFFRPDEGLVLRNLPITAS